MSVSGIWPPLHDDTKPGDPVGKIRGDEYAKICRIFNTIQIVGPGELVKTPDGREWKLVLRENDLHDFDPRFDGENIYRTAGHRCIMGFHNGWELLPENSTPVTGNGTYWMRWVYTTKAAKGSFTEGYGTPPAQDATCTVALLWTVTDGVVEYHERGAKRFFDWDVC